MTVQVGYLGPVGTFSEQAAQQSIVNNMDQKYILKAYPTIPQVIWAVEKGEIQKGVVPVENSIEGTVSVTLDMLAHNVNIPIQGEVVIDIQHCLVAREKGANQITKVYSHPLALAQCRTFLQDNYPQACHISTSSTAEAVILAKEEGNSSAALGSAMAAKIYGLEIICNKANDFEVNKTRFLIIGESKDQKQALLNKTSLCLALAENKPGGLYEILGEFEKMKIDLTKIESRPAKTELGNYIFFIDCKANILEEKYADVLEGLKAKSSFLKILGTY